MKYSLLLMLGLMLAERGHAQASPSSCTAYAATCTSSQQCCYYPSILCLPDVRNSTSCLSVFDVINLSPALTGANLLAPLLTAASGNGTSAIGAVAEVVKVNGTTIYNATELITPNSVLQG